jgi:ppGpp synthetase/RelA/SpoT-type nucleotidyltranferase
VTHRAKRPAALLAKLRERDQERRYASSQAIRDDIADLAGVRIALYFPEDRENIGMVLRENFTIDLEKNFPRDGKPKRQLKRFDGYRADHYRIYMQDSSLDDTQSNMPLPK